MATQETQMFFANHLFSSLPQESKWAFMQNILILNIEESLEYGEESFSNLTWLKIKGYCILKKV